MKKKILALVMVVALLGVSLITGTLAYFTDTHTAENVFVVGNVDIELWEDNNDGKSNNGDPNGNNDEYTPWLKDQNLVPGVSIEKDAWIKNVGKNDAYVRVLVTVPANIVIKWDNTDKWEKIATTTDGGNTVYTLAYHDALAAGATAEDFMTAFEISEWIKNGEIADGKIVINAEAIQVGDFTSRDEAFSKLDAQKLVDAGKNVATTADELEAALAEGGEIIIADDITLTETITVPAGTTVTIDLAGKTITGSNAKGAGALIANNGTLTLVGGTAKNTTVNGDAVINNSGTLTLDGVTIVGAPIDDSGYPSYAVISSGDLTIEEGTVIESDRGVLSLSGGKTVINGGSLYITDAANTRPANITTHTIAANTGATLSIYGGEFENKYIGESGASVICPWGGTINVYGGDFSIANPAGQNGSFQNYMGYGADLVKVYGGTFGDDSVKKWVATGYEATESNGTWTVDRKTETVTVPAANVTTDKTANGALITDALADAAAADPDAAVEIALPEGEYKMPSIGGDNEFTITGTKDTVIDITLGAYMDSANVSFEGVTIKGSRGKANGNGSDDAALYTPNVTYTNCTFVGPFAVGRDGAKFINCEFTELGNDYVWIMGNDVTFEGCTFNTDGKAILVYAHGTYGGDGVSTVVVKNCKFNSTAGAKAGAISNQNCAAIEIHNYGCNSNVTTSGNTYDSNFSGEWRIKQFENNGKYVIVNGTEYTKTALDGKLMTVTSTVATFD